jgi:adenine phosphoribosyltransferase
MTVDVTWLEGLVRDVPDFPKPGIIFKDVTPLWADASAFRFSIDAIADHYAGVEIDRVVGIEARGFILAAPVAYRFGAGFVPVRKPGKLPAEIASESYELEYGTDTLEIHRDGILAGQRVLIVDDVLATGGTAAATIRLVEALGGSVVGLGFLLELGFLRGRERLTDYELVSLITYE